MKIPFATCHHKRSTTYRVCYAQYSINRQIIVFMIYNLDHKGYKCLHLPSGCVYILRNVIFNETSFPFKPQSIGPFLTQTSSQTFSLPIILSHRAQPIGLSLPTSLSTLGLILPQTLIHHLLPLPSTLLQHSQYLPSLSLRFPL